jgi:hypothetical protein
MSALRNQTIVRLYRDGWTVIELAEKYGLTKGRISQILDLYGVSYADGGIAVQRARRKAAMRPFISPMEATA